jgi:hypothetical protein
VYLEVQVYNSDTPAWETLSPRIQIVSAAYALNTDHLDGTNSDQFLRSDTGDNFTSGTLTIDSGTTLDVDGTLQMDGSVTKATTDLVTNFNSDLLDGLHSSSFSLTGHTHPGSDITSPVPSASDADTLDGFDSTYFLNTSSTAQTKLGPLTLDASGAAAYGVEAQGQTGGGYFIDSDDSGYAFIGHTDYGILAYGRYTGGYFKDSDSTGVAYAGKINTGLEAAGSNRGGYFYDTDDSGYAYVGHGNSGITASGTSYGGYFSDSDSSGRAYAAIGDTGIEARGNNEGGYFIDSDDTGYAYVADGNYGIRAYGSSAGGYFKDSDSSGYAHVGSGDNGILANGNNYGGSFSDLDQSGLAYVGYGDRGIDAQGSETGGYFKDSDGTGEAYIGYGDRGIEAKGSVAGGYLKDSDGTGEAYIGYGDTGIEAYGSSQGGYFKDSDGSGEAYIGWTDEGIRAAGNGRGGYFLDGDSSGYASVGVGDGGIDARGNGYGGYFKDLDNLSTAWVAYNFFGIDAGGSTAGGNFDNTGSAVEAKVAYSTYKIYGTGTVSFVQNHPSNKNQVIVYAAPEGDEVATYTRGTARLVGNEAKVSLGETFKWVTNPDIGLTAYVTPRGDAIPLSVASLTTEELVVKGPADYHQDIIFDYMVFGLRIGFEESSIVQNKNSEAYIPSMKDHRDLYDQNPELRHYNAFERFETMNQSIGEIEPIDLSDSLALKNAIEEYDPAIHGPVRAYEPDNGYFEPAIDSLDRKSGAREDNQEAKNLSVIGQDRVKSPIDIVPVDEDGNIHAKSFRSVSPDLTGNVSVSEQVEVGDVVVVDPMNPGMMKLTEMAADPSVIGIVAGEPGVVLGGGLIEVEVSESDGEQPLEEKPVEINEEALASELEEDESSIQVQSEVGMYQAQAPVALSGIVVCKVDAAYGSIQIGDLLTTSPTKGHAMRSIDHVPGTIIGKAIEPLDAGTGLVKVLVMMR